MIERTLSAKIGVPAAIVLTVLAVVTLAGEGPAVAGGALLLIGALIQAMTSASSTGVSGEVQVATRRARWRDSFILAGWVVITFGAFFSFLAVIPAPAQDKPKVASGGWWIFTNEWMLQLFSGTVGALIGAVVAAAAAVWVLNRTNAKQQELWDASKLAQDRRDAESRQSQERAHSAQLKAQERQIEESYGRQLAAESKARQIKSAADMTTGILQLRRSVDKGEQEVIDASHISTEAGVRWAIELYGVHDVFAEQLSRWSTGLYHDARALRALREEALKRTDLIPTYNAYMRQYEEIAGSFIGIVSKWLADVSGRDGIVDRLRTGNPGGTALIIRDNVGVGLPWLNA